MGKRGNKRNRFDVRDQQVKQQATDMKPEELAVYIRRAEKKVLPTIKNMELSAGAAMILLAQYTHVLVTGNPRLTWENTSCIVSSIITLWEKNQHQPDPEYPFTLEETRFDLESGAKAQNDYSKCFQPFISTHPHLSRSVGLIAGGVVQHPKTHLWQIWMMIDGPCEFIAAYGFIAAYSDVAMAQKMLEEIITTIRRGDGPSVAQSLYQRIVSQGDGEPRQIPLDMMAYLIDHLHLYLIKL